MCIHGEAVSYTHLDVYKRQRRLRGPKDSKVNLKILRRGVKELLPFTVKRDKIPVYERSFPVTGYG